MTDQVTTQEVLTTADGVPLKISLKRAMRRKMITSLLLVTPLFLFILLTFLMPITDMLLRSVDNKIVGELLPRTIPLFSGWDENVLCMERIDDIEGGKLACFKFLAVEIGEYTT